MHIDIIGWKREYLNLTHFLNTAEKATVLREIQGNHILLRNGVLCPNSHDYKLHTYFGEVDLEEDYTFPHIHLSDGFTLGDIDPESFKESTKPRLRGILFSRPHYTLEGLYSTLPNERINTRINAMQKELFERKGYLFESIVTRKAAKLKLLENAYKRIISNQ